MSKPVNVQILERARALIEDERYWCRGDIARDAMGSSVGPTDGSAVKRCALGALWRRLVKSPAILIWRTSLPLQQ